jgi:hypothetical protein
MHIKDTLIIKSIYTYKANIHYNYLINKIQLNDVFLYFCPIQIYLYIFIYKWIYIDR